HVENDGRVVDGFEFPRVLRQLPGDDPRAKLLDSAQFFRQIDVALPVGNGLSQLPANAIHGTPFSGFRQEDSFGRGKRFAKLPQPNGPLVWDHVRREAGLGLGHEERSASRLRPAGSEVAAGVVRLGKPRSYSLPPWATNSFFSMSRARSRSFVTWVALTT